MTRNIKLFVGLGNPGIQYSNTRHNFGFMVLDKVAESLCLQFKSWNNIADICSCDVFGSKAWFLKPYTFMNLSGSAIALFAKYYKIKPEEAFVFYDDFSIALGEYKVRMSGSSGGHNGIKSVIEYLNTENFARMKLGIGPLPKINNVAHFVLSNFLNEDKEKISLIKNNAVLFVEETLKVGVDKVVSMFANKHCNK